jgi:plastocyanin
MQHLFRLAALGTLPLLAGACGNSKTLAPGSATGFYDACTVANASNSKTVLVTDGGFTPSCVAVTRGTQVTFSSAGAQDHTVSSASGEAEPFALSDLTPGTSVAHTFQTPGTFAIVCDFHPEERLTVIVVGS